MSIRMATAADLPAMLAIYAPYVENTTYSFEYAPPTAEAFAHRFDTITQQFPWLVWEEHGAILGYAYASAPFERASYRWCAEPSIYVAHGAHRQGIGKKLYACLEEILRLQGYRTLYAIVTAENSGSIDFHTAAGYTFLAEFPGCGYKFGRWLGITWLQKRLDSVESPSDFPINWRCVVKNDRNFVHILDTLSLS